MQVLDVYTCIGMICDLCYSIWDAHNGTLIKTLTFPSTPCSLEITRDGSRLVIAHCQKVSFFSTDWYILFYMFMFYDVYI